jgi:hypothetical protein
MRVAEIIAKAGAKMMRDYVKELRRQGKIKGNLYIVLKDGKKQFRRPFREA